MSKLGGALFATRINTDIVGKDASINGGILIFTLQTREVVGSRTKMGHSMCKTVRRDR